MTPAPLSDEDVDRLLAARDPIDPALLQAACRAPPARSSDGRSGRHAGPAGPAGAGALLPAGDSHDSRLGPAPASAAVVLDRAARMALSQAAVSPTARQYEYVKVQEGYATSVSEGHVGVRFWESDTKQDWFKRDGSGRERIVDSREGLLTPTDRAIARAHGLSLRRLMPNQDGDSRYPAGGISYYSLYSPFRLPSQPSRLLPAIDRELRATRTPSTAADVFNVISNRLLFSPTSPSLRAALYQVIARLPGVQLLGSRTDRIGRRGVAVTISHVKVGDEGTRTVLLFDPATSDVLQTEEIQEKPFHSPNAPPSPRGRS